MQGWSYLLGFEQAEACCLDKRQPHNQLIAAAQEDSEGCAKRQLSWITVK